MHDHDGQSDRAILLKAAHFRFSCIFNSMDDPVGFTTYLSISKASDGILGLEHGVVLRTPNSGKVHFIPRVYVRASSILVDDRNNA
jgi:hypothetical protein